MARNRSPCCLSVIAGRMSEGGRVTLRCMRMSTRILIADDDATIRLLLRRLLEKQPDWQADRARIARLLQSPQHLAMPVMNGLQAGPEIAKAHPRLPMLLISAQEVSNQLAREARNAGYRGAVTKSGGDEVLKGIEASLRHEMFFYSDDGSFSPTWDESALATRSAALASQPWTATRQYGTGIPGR
jgi:CheY-like chemotaxis protein